MKPVMKTVLWSVIFAVIGLVASAASALEPIAEAFSNYGDVSVELMSVDRKGNVLTVKWAARNNGDAEQSVAFGITGERISYVVDEENGTKYYVLEDQEGNPLASANDWITSDTDGITYKIGPGEVRRHWAKFPAPPPEVKTVSVFFTETEPFEEIEIREK